MGRSRLIPIIIELLETPGMYITPMEWRTKHEGKPTLENVQKFVYNFVQSQKTGEPNFGVADKLIVPNRAKVYKQTRNGRELLTEWTAPTFWAI